LGLEDPLLEIAGIKTRDYLPFLDYAAVRSDLMEAQAIPARHLKDYLVGIEWDDLATEGGGLLYCNLFEDGFRFLRGKQSWGRPEQQGAS